MLMADRDVLIVGAGPTGLMLAGELALAGVDVAIVERRKSQELEGPRSRGLHSRTIEVLDQRGIADRFLAEGQTAQIQSFAGIRLDISDFPARHHYGLALEQNRFERILAGWVSELGVPVLRAREVTGASQDGDGVVVGLSNGGSLRAGYVVGCDGGRSVVRKTAGIEFPGWEPSVNSFIAEAEMTEQPPWGIRYDANGTQALGPLDEGRRVGIVVTEPFAGQTREPTLEDLRRALTRAWGTDFGVHSPTWLSRFTDLTRQAAAYRKGRVLLAGDAAHVHYPVGGQGLNLGVQDAVNLGWKLAAVVKGTAPERLLDTYHAERHPVAARVLQITMAQTALTRSDERISALRATLADLLGMDEPRKRFAATLSGLDIQYDLGEGHPLTGCRMLDIEVVTAGGPVRVFELLHDARAVLLDVDRAGAFDVRPWAGRVRLVKADYTGTWELPALGTVDPPPVVLIRPDGYVAWAGNANDPGLVGALTTWLGPPKRG
ncbi:FAD-dependent monooxygenase [Sinomonas sp. JGH33]|uniref:FAD-dependent monooxygenase n=1 Tax=Sinomonas terricola TaxID=3110330 RepID=A0ABU5TCE8_9MICC|nr:FAD-dependent monooxygenase [Sinomonas sp. JGH33]MEA5457367.1 FAD-dependent monooxygenase [Sinomonas sp. JGH33]